MALAIDSTNAPYINLVQTALDTLMGLAGALTYTPQNYGGEVTIPLLGAVPLAPMRTVILVTEGPHVGAAQAMMPRSATLVRRVIASQHWTRIIHDNANDCTPDKWLKDAMWSGFKGYVPGVHADQGFMRKVMTTGGSSVVRWVGMPNLTADLAGMMNIIKMLNVASYILLAHELIHADRIARGLLLTGIANSTFLVDQRQIPNPLGGPPIHRVHQAGFTSATALAGNLTLPGRIVSNAGSVITARVSGQVWLDGTMERAEEIATVGLSDDTNAVPADPLAITENMIRAEHGMNKRLKYGAFNRAVA